MLRLPSTNWQPEPLPYNLSRGRDDQPRPTHEKTKTAERRDRAEPAQICQRHRVQTAAEKKNTGEKQPPRAPISAVVKRQHQECDGVNEMIEHCLVPDMGHAVTFNCRS